MRYRITFVAGLAVGYVLGARAGKARYEQIARTARRIADSPAVQETAGLVGAQVSNATKTVWTKINERVPVTSLRDFLARPTPEEEAEVRRTELNGRALGDEYH
ncbi:hypothetical protein [Marinitenerispora sediminis]|uniref:YtxH domain-containing protein n=1 Tax=Marinitenerispora sediminis TaxID=1931232 RepID=A0A368T348_9ACTN|nr:hypothetical protein [Marinitenerispora sediminis]RCV55982.1 hypothetical protein DEF24_17225 [Marinitenerispora sediminis]RCV56302.1 hypothetical protein DEF28_03930 [Marinitenerispora sediminis]RCV61234.1 hypothetical protein DEF23_02845 [Marinitenerispora sediminis]